MIKAVTLSHKTFIIFFFCFGIAQNANAETIDKRATDLFASGQYKAAAAIAAQNATQNNDADNFAFAARSIITEISINRPSKASNASINLAQSYIDKALKIEKNNKDALLMDASLLLIKARKVGPVGAFSLRYPQHAKQKLDKILTLYPNFGEAMALRATWHLESIRIGGTTGILMGADEAIGIKEFNQALNLDNNNIFIPFVYANTLILLDKNKYKNAYLKLLDKCLTIKVDNKNEQMIIQRAKDLKKLIEENKIDNAKQLAQSWL